MSTVALKYIRLSKFLRLSRLRRAKIKEAEPENARLLKSHAANALAEELHPPRQKLIVTKVREEAPGIISYTLCAAAEGGSSPLGLLPPLSFKGNRSALGSVLQPPRPAPFSAGQYLSVSFKINGSPVTRPFSISSSPRECRNGTYTVTVKSAPGGFVSDYIHKNWQKGTPVTVSAPLGTFTYEGLRDAKTVVGIAGGSGVTPFLSMAKAIADGDEDFNLILLYGTRTLGDAAFLEEFRKLERTCPKFRLVNVLSDAALPEEDENDGPGNERPGEAGDTLAGELGGGSAKRSPQSKGQRNASRLGLLQVRDIASIKKIPGEMLQRFIPAQIKEKYAAAKKEDGAVEYGFITAELIEKYAPRGEKYSVFMCGPQAMYDFEDKEIEKLGIERKYVRHELFGGFKNPAEKNTYILTVRTPDEKWKILAESDEPLIVSMEKAGIAAPSRCRGGLCGFCRSRLVEGDVYIPENADGRRKADKKYGYVHPCVSFPLSDITIEVPPAAE